MKSLLICSFLVFVCITLNAQGHNANTRSYREEWKKSMLQDPRSPLDSTDFHYVVWFEPDSAFVISYRFEKLINTPEQQIPTYSGKQKNFRPYGKLWFYHLDKLHSLTIFQTISTPAMMAMDDHLFLPFKDYTNGNQTYGGGRYLDIQKSTLEDGSFKLDFNRAYNPWCAYSSGYNCPVPPVENHLPFEIQAGEKMYTGPYKQRD
ncbi:MAG: DUF1684 domain-containing protein [Saprospiraceae bacterium]|nr:DUF1684 domain-containing protein [Saprospiraceae bacterium]